MAKIAIVSDIHGNWHALQAVMAEIQTLCPDRIVCLGDTVGYGADPAKCIEHLRGLGATMIMGNHDLMVLHLRIKGIDHLPNDWSRSGELAGYVHSMRELSDEQLRWLKDSLLVDAEEQCLLAHANLHQPLSFGHLQNLKQARPTLDILKLQKMPVGFFGHTHVQEVFCQKPSNLVWVDERSFRVSSDHPAAVMVGSVGMSREAGDLRAAWAVYDSATGVVELRKTEYDRIGAAVAILHAGLPLETAFNLLTKEEYHQLLS